MKKLLLLLYCGTLSIAQDVHVESLKQYTKAQINANSLIVYSNSYKSVQYDVNLYKVKYRTLGLNGDSILVSGLLALPVLNFEENELPLLSDQHGLITNNLDAPTMSYGSLFSFTSYSTAIAALFAGSGYVVCMPDYMGFGENYGLHPVMHSESEVSCTIDLIKAVKKYCASQGIKLNKQLFLSGYSQGAHASIASAERAENELHEFVVTAVSGQSGAYDLSGIMYNMVMGNSVYDAPSFIPYILLSYHMVYGNLYNTISEALDSTLSRTIPPMYGKYSILDINTKIGQKSSRDIFTTDYYNYMVSSTLHPLRVALAKNDVFRTKIQAAVKLYYCEGDELIPHHNSIVARDSMTAHGAGNVSAIRVDTDAQPYTHGLCIFETYKSTKAWFDPYVASTALQIGDRLLSPEIFYRMDDGKLNLNFEKSFTGVAYLIDTKGQIMAEKSCNDCDMLIFDRGLLSSGIYLLKIVGNININMKVVGY